MLTRSLLLVLFMHHIHSSSTSVAPCPALCCMLLSPTVSQTQLSKQANVENNFEGDKLSGMDGGWRRRRTLHVKHAEVCW